MIAAIGSLNRFQLALLELACLLGGTVTAARAREEGLGASDFKAGSAQLEEFGLAFRDPDGTLHALPQAGALISNPGGLGPPAASLLSLQNLEFLRFVAARVGVPSPERPNQKGELAAVIAAHLARDGVVAELLSGMPPAAITAFTEIREAGGSADLRQISSQPRDWSWRWQPQLAKDGPWWLTGRALALPTDADRIRLAIPAEVELVLRGRLFPRWYPVQPEVVARPLREPRHPLQVVVALRSLVLAWRREPPPAIQQGGPGKRDVRRAAQALGIEDDDAHAVAHLGIQLGVLEEVELVPEKKSRSRRNPRVLQPRRAVITAGPNAAGWEALDEPERWLAIWRSRLPQAEVPRLRAVMQALAALPAGKGATAAGLGRFLHWRHPGLFAGAEDAAELAYELGGQLEWLGGGGGEPVVGLGAAGRAAAGLVPDLEALRAALPAESGECTVTADHRVIVPGRPSLELEQLLAGLAEVESIQPARVYRLTEASLRAALDEGLGATEILARLGRFAPAGLPPNVVRLIEDLGHRHGRLRIGRAGLYLQTDDEAQLQELLRLPGLRGLGLRAVGPTVAVMEGDDLEAAVGLLRRAGQMPVVEGAAPEAASAPPRRAAAAGPGRAPAVAGPALAADPVALAAGLRAGPAPGSGTTPVRRGSRLEDIVSAAVRSRRLLQLGLIRAGGRKPAVVELFPLRIANGRIEGLDVGGRKFHRLATADVLWAAEIDQFRLDDDEEDGLEVNVLRLRD